MPVPDVLLLSYRSNTDDQREGKRPLSKGPGRWFMLDQAFPDWTEFPSASLLWTRDESEALAPKRAARAIKKHDPTIVVAFGRDTCHALGLARTVKWFTGYRLPDGPLVIPCPTPTPLNRTMNDKKVRRKLAKLLTNLADPAWVQGQAK